MQKSIEISLLASEAADPASIRQYISQNESISPEKITGYIIQKKSLDARGRSAKIRLSLTAFIDEPFVDRNLTIFNFENLKSSAPKVIIVGAGPAGLFAALKLIEAGIKPIVLERGKNVRDRRRDLAALNKQGEVNSESNYCFGEGGAGTYSDGKLYTRSSKRGSIERILDLFHYFGAEEKILYEAHPHIGTNKLPAIITAIREKIIACGGEIHFEKKVTDLLTHKDTVSGVQTADGEKFNGVAVLLATGHSARDIFKLLYNKKIFIEAKPFALGVRAEHPQGLIDSLQYHCIQREEYLPPASYSLVEQVNEKGVFSFCMCPGGIIAPAATSPGELVVNGWSPSKRNNPFANSGIVVQVNTADLKQLEDFEKITGQPLNMLLSPLGLMYFQQYIERKAFTAGGGKMVAPAQRMVDFTEKKVSASLPPCSYLPGVNAADLTTVLPSFIYNRLGSAFRAFGKKMTDRRLLKSYFTNEAIVVATESRTSSPVRIPRDPTSLQHPQIKNLYPCAEGAGYAGGIVSAAMDGENVAALIAAKITNQV